MNSDHSYNETIAMCMVKQLYKDKVIDDKTYEAVCKKHNSIFAQNKHMDTTDSENQLYRVI